MVCYKIIFKIQNGANKPHKFEYYEKPEQTRRQQSNNTENSGN